MGVVAPGALLLEVPSAAPAPAALARAALFWGIDLSSAVLE